MIGDGVGGDGVDDDGGGKVDAIVVVSCDVGAAVRIGVGVIATGVGANVSTGVGTGDSGG